MMNKKELMDTLENDINVLQRKIKYKRLYNLRNLIIHRAIDAGLKVEKLLPFIISALIVYCSESAIGNVPFKSDTITDDSYLQTMENKDGVIIEKQSFDVHYNDNYLEYSTNWELNDNGLFERVITSFEIDDSFDLEDKDTILNMSLEDISKLLLVNDVRTIQKSSLDDDDVIYKEPMVILTTFEKDENNKRKREETLGENINYSFIYLLLSLSLGLGLDKVKSILVKTYIVDELEKIKGIYEIIDIDDLQKLLQIKLNNMEKLNNSGSRQSPGYIYTLRKRG